MGTIKNIWEELSKMKKIIFFLFIILGLNYFSQTYNTPDDLYKEYHFTINANQTQPFVPDIPAIGIDDYVYFEVSNNTISLGPYIGNTYADGTSSITVNRYKKYDSYKLGSVVCLVNNVPYCPTRQMFNKVTDIYYYVADESKMVNLLGQVNYIPGNNFISTQSGKLSFCINDNEPQNNQGSYTLDVYIMKKTAHLSRNMFNTCPRKPPKEKQLKDKYYDCNAKEWSKESLKSIYYHGANYSFRGNRNYPGCQCIYLPLSGKLLKDNYAEGSFDIGFWKYDGAETSKSKHLHLIIDMIPHDLLNVGLITNLIDGSKYNQYNTEFCENEIPTLFLFDVSGSMSENNKWYSTKQSALNTLNNIKAQTQSANISPSISILSFDGECNSNPTKNVIDFTSNLKDVEAAINTKIPKPGGATPLPQAIEVSEKKLKDYLASNNLSKGKLIILTDGESSCGSIRPAGVYSYDIYNAGFSGSDKTSAKKIKYYAVGFDIQPGSAAERDLQYFTQINGGKYVNAQNGQELTNAFQKFNRIFIPKPTPAITSVSDSDNIVFQRGISLIYDEEYDEALKNYSKYYKNNATDYNGVYNLALMSEANDLYKSAMKYYEAYLQLNPKAKDKAAVQQTIESLKITAKTYAEYNKKIVQSDLGFLDLHFKKIQNGESVALAGEFIGFLNEKYNFYKNISSITENEDRLFKTNANEVYKGLKDCSDAIKRNPQTWDRDASPIISRTYLNMERLLEAF